MRKEVKNSYEEYLNKCKKIYVKNGVLQGDVLSPTLFIIALDSILRRIPQKWRTFILHTLGYADDLALLCNNAEEVTEKLQALKQFSKKTGLKVNIQNNKMKPGKAKANPNTAYYQG